MVGLGIVARVLAVAFERNRLGDFHRPGVDRDRNIQLRKGGHHIAMEIRHGHRRQREMAFASVRSPDPERSEEHTSELQSLMRISYAVFCLKTKKKRN